jgi:acetyl/propionyl-CoA carboxylase alpha subunit
MIDFWRNQFTPFLLGDLFLNLNGDKTDLGGKKNVTSQWPPLTAPLTGKIVEIKRKLGDVVKEDDEIAPAAGTIKEIRVSAGETIGAEGVLAIIEWAGAKEVKNLTTLEFGLTMTVIGMGGTLVILFLISLVVDVLNKFLPHREGKKE